MKSYKRSTWFLAGFSLLTILSLAGATTGTLAWYAYVTRASMSYIGTSVAKTEQLQIGIRDDGVTKQISDGIISAYGYERDSDNIVWAPEGTGFNAEVISEYVKNVNKEITTKEGTYANSLSPVTTKQRALNSKDILTLYDPPMAGNPVLERNARSGSYMELPFAFRIIDNNGNYLGDKSIWITDALAKMKTSGKTITNALRMFIDDPTDTSHDRRFILNPSSDANGYTLLAGCLDLNSDGYYDTYPATAGENAGKEILYGSGCYSGTPTYGSPRAAATTVIDDINHTGHTEETTFTAMHMVDSRSITNYDSLVFDKAYYYGKTAARPTPNGTTGLFEGGLPVTYVDDTTKVGFTNLTIYLEGWDHSVIDQEAEYQFNLGITFEIDRI